MKTENGSRFAFLLGLTGLVAVVCFTRIERAGGLVPLGESATVAADAEQVDPIIVAHNALDRVDTQFKSIKAEQEQNDDEQEDGDDDNGVETDDD